MHFDNGCSFITCNKCVTPVRDVDNREDYGEGIKGINNYTYIYFFYFHHFSIKSLVIEKTSVMLGQEEKYKAFGKENAQKSGTDS